MACLSNSVHKPVLWGKQKLGSNFRSPCVSVLFHRALLIVALTLLSPADSVRLSQVKYTACFQVSVVFKNYSCNSDLPHQGRSARVSSCSFLRWQ